MKFKGAVRDLTISAGLYGPLRKTYRQLFDKVEKDQLRKSSDLYRKFVLPGDLCFDVGSNVGERAEVFLSLGAKVVAFEPLPHCAREISARCSNDRSLTVVQAAMGAATGVAEMTVGKWSKVSSLAPGWVRDQDVKEIIRVPVTTLDDAIKTYGLPAFCKIDVEGFELQVLRGLSRPIRTMTLEYDTSDAGNQKTFDCIEYLSQFGAFEINITSGESTDFVWPDWGKNSEIRARFPLIDPASNFGDIFIRYL